MHSLFGYIGLSLKLLRNLVRFYFVYSFKKIKKKSSPTRVVVVNAKNVFIERVYAQLLFALHDSGYKILLVHNFNFLSNLVEYNHSIASLPHLSLIASPSKIDDDILYLTDFDHRIKSRFRMALITEEMFDVKTISTDQNILPFPMIPRLYFSGQYKIFETIREGDRKIRIYFSGNSNPEQYDHTIFQSCLKKLSRVEIIKQVKLCLGPDELQLVHDNSEFDLSYLKDKLVISEWKRDKKEGVVVKGRTSNEDWLVQLSQVDFFLACPGFIQPLCHNLIESMSVGTIPLLEHSEYLNPPLVHGINCITFSGKDDLVSKIRLVLSMNPSDILKMRKEVIEYYENHLSPRAVCSFVEQSAANNQVIKLITSNYYQRMWGSGLLKNT